MAQPSPKAVEWIRSQVTDWKRSDVELAEQINARTMPNPKAAPTELAPFSGNSLLAKLSPESVTNLAHWPNLDPCLRDIRAGDRDAVRGWGVLLLAGGLITQEDAATITAALDARQIVPGYTATVPVAVVELGRLVDAEDLAAARVAK